MPSVGLVLPAYQPDVDRLEAYLDVVRERLDPDAVRIEIDDPPAEIRPRLASLPATVSAVPFRRGKGAAITAGFEALETDVLAFADADGATPPDSLASVLEPVRSGRADLAAGSRRHPQATVTSHQTAGRRVLGDAFAWLARRVLETPMYDYQCGAKAISATGWTAVGPHLGDPGFAWDVELMAIAGARGLRIAEVPIEWHDQPGSTVSPVADAIQLARTLFSARRRARELEGTPEAPRKVRVTPEPPAIRDGKT